jgi:hypothetical protein
MRLSTAVAGATICAGLAASAATVGARVPLVPSLTGVALAASSDDRAIQRAFQDVLKREPRDWELRRYRTLMEDNGWREADIRRDLRERTDYQSYSTNRSMQPERIIRRAYEDILGREPDADGLRTYRSKMIDQGWTEADVRNALRQSDEYAASGAGSFRTRSADRIIRRAYQDILGREPDPQGMDTYRRNIIERGWDEQDVREALRKSPERRVTGGRPVDSGISSARYAVSDAQATDMVVRAYRSVLGRDPDPEGLASYKAKVMRDHWTDSDLTKALRSSPEYRSKH